MSNKKPKRFKKVVEYDWEEIWSIDGIDSLFKVDSYWGIIKNIFSPLWLFLIGIVLPIAYLISMLCAPFHYFTERKVYYEEVKG